MTCRAVLKRLPAFLLAVVIAGWGCGRSSKRSVNVVGSTSVQPFAEMLAQEYNDAHPDVDVEVQGGGSTAGVQALLNGLADIGTCSRGLKDEERVSCRGIVIARDGLALIVHKSNTVGDVTLQQVRSIFSGALRNWKEIGGPDRPIRPITREEGSGTREAFEVLVMNKTPIAAGAITQESNGAVRELVRTDPAAIGYMSLGLVGTEVNTLKVDEIEPSSAAVLAGTYSLVRPFLFVVKDGLRPDAQAFIDFTLSAEGQALLEKEGLIRSK